MNSAKSRPEKTALNFGASSIADVKERVVAEEVVVENLVTVLLVHITALTDAVSILNSCAQDLISILVIDCFPLGYKLIKFNFVTYGC